MSIDRMDPTNCQYPVIVHAGGHDRRHCPVSMVAPKGICLPSLYRQGRNRPVACQIDESSGKAVIWWLVDRLPAGKSVQYTLQQEGRIRQSPARVFIRPSPAGWAFRREEATFAEFLCLDQGTPQMTVLDGRGHHLAELTCRPAEFAEGMTGPTREVRFHRVRRSNAEVVEGPVYGTLAVAYDYVDHDGLPLWMEEYQWRLFDGPDHFAILDLSVSWHAIATAVSLTEPGKVGGRPVLRSKFADEHPQIIGDPDRIGRVEIDRLAAPTLLASTASAKIGLFSATNPFATPPWWCFESDHIVDVVPSSFPCGIGRWRTRLALGESMVWRYRIVISTSSGDMSSVAGKYNDFASPPHVELQENEAAQDD